MTPGEQESLSGVERRLEKVRAQVRQLEEELELTSRGVTALTLELETSRERLRALVEQAPTAFYLIRLDGRIVETNRLASEMTGYSSDELEGMAVWNLSVRIPDEASFREEIARLRNEGFLTLDTRHRRRDGSIFPAEVRVGLLEVGGEQLVVALALDITERKELQNQLVQAQKMEAVGRLAGGVAHDFNNVLTVILGETEMARSLLDPSPDLQEALDQIHRAGERAAALTRKLLTFSRQDMPEPRLVDSNHLVQELESAMLRHVISEDVELEIQLEEGVWPVLVDFGQLEQVLLNLVINGRDAMPGGGRLRIQTRNITLDDAYVESHPDATAGDHVEIVVRDTGTGMTNEVLERLFEPFFTTKEEARGTGLGLTTSYGIVKQSGGHISVYSDLGTGTAMKVYLPRAEGDAAELREDLDAESAPGGAETIVLVEDDDDVRHATARMLETLGYQVTAFADGESALEALRDALEPDLIVTDVMLPGMGGAEMARQVRDVWPDLPILYASGYAGEVLLLQDLLDEEADVIQKPFRMGELARRVRTVLDRHDD